MPEKTKKLEKNHKNSNLLDFSCKKFRNFDILKNYQNFEKVDFSKNPVTILTFSEPLLSLKVLILNDSPISQIDPRINKMLPKLTHLALNYSKISSINSFNSFINSDLKHLYILGTPLSLMQNYRQELFEMIPSLRSVDFVMRENIDFKKKEKSENFEEKIIFSEKKEKIKIDKKSLFDENDDL